MRNLIGHRGPDDNGYASIEFADGRIQTGDTPKAASLQMGFSRLSIRDLSHFGHQPMVTGDGKLALVFNGEIYNTKQLIAEHLRGVPLKSSGDTEVVLRMCQKLGLEITVGLLDGMFAIALYNGRTRQLELARDRFGIKPLYYSHWENSFSFASEIKPLLASGLFPKEMDPEAISELSVFRYVAEPLTPFKHVYTLPPGTIARLNDNGQLKTQQYWTPSYDSNISKNTKSIQSNTELTASVVQKAVSSQLVSDVQVGLELSGGIDSSLVAWAAGGTGLNGYSAVPDSDALSEERHIDHVSAVTQTETHKSYLTPDSIADSIGEVAYYHETPINHEGSIGIYQVCKLAKSNGVSVLMSGEGADELFAGYRRHGIVHSKLSKARLVSRFTSPYSSLLPRRFQTANRLWKNRDTSIILASRYGNPDLVHSIFPQTSVAMAVAKRQHHMDGFNWSQLDESHLIYDQKTYMVDLLARQDKLSMAHSIETRVPFLANSMAELSSSLPMSQKLGNSNEGKILLKKVVAQEFGDSHAYRQKWGFGLPYSFMAQNETIGELAKSCAVGLEADGVIRETKDLFSRAVAGDGYADRMAWILMSMGMWYDLYFRNAERVSQFVKLPSTVNS
jgi:asparagine synthase (glutamine-hydrolysing)